jgi:hypothetical protein
MKYIAFAGLAGVGKTTASAIAHKRLTQQWGLACLRMSFAQPIRSALEMLGVDKVSHPTQYRDIAQHVGHYLRECDADWWVNRVRDKMAGRPDISNFQVVIFDDMRYNNEMGFVEDRGGETFFVQAGARIDTSLPLYQHESEWLALQYHEGKLDARCDFTGIIDGSGSYDEYEAKVIHEIDRIGFEVTDAGTH